MVACELPILLMPFRPLGDFSSAAVTGRQLNVPGMNWTALRLRAVIPGHGLEALPNAAIRALLDGDLDVAAAQLNADSRFVADVDLGAVPNALNRIVSIRALHYLGRANDTLLDEFPGEGRLYVALRALVRALLGRCDDALALRAPELHRVRESVLAVCLDAAGSLGFGNAF